MGTATDLIEQQDMRSLHAEHREGDSRLLSSREGRNLLETRQSGDPERSEMLSVLLLRLARELGREEGDGRERQVEGVDVLFKGRLEKEGLAMQGKSWGGVDETKGTHVLGEEGDSQSTVSDGGTLEGLKISDEEFDPDSGNRT